MRSIVAIIIVAVAVISFGQTATKKAASAKSDTWQKSKDCANQAEKVMAVFDSRSVAMGFPGSMSWQNHYSPKYDKCFVSADYIDKDGGIERNSAKFSTQLIDAFERTVLANSASVGPTDGFCRIDHQPADCAKAESFIAERMKN